MLGLQPEENSGSPNVAPAKAVDQVARERVLAGRADGLLTFRAVGQPDGVERLRAAFWPAVDSRAGGLEVARPTDMAIRMAEITLPADTQQSDHPIAFAAAVAPLDGQLDDVADAEAAPHRTDDWVAEGQNPVLKAEGAVPETGHRDTA